MGNHVHLVIETPEANLSAGMQRLHSGYAMALNGRHARSGHVFQGRFGSKLIKDDQQFAATFQYVADNPVKAGLCQLPEEWPWSSYRATVGLPVPDWLDRSGLLRRLGSARREDERGLTPFMSGV